MQSKIRCKACSIAEIYCFTTMLRHMQLFKLQNSSHHLAGNKYIILPTDHTQRLVHSSSPAFEAITSLSVLCDDNDDIRRTVQCWLSSQVALFYEEGMKNQFHTTTNPLIFVETVLKNSLRFGLSFENKIVDKILFYF